MEDLKPIHKFNGGIGATLCHKCRAIISEGLTEDLYCENCDEQKEEIYKYRLVRERDGLTKLGDNILWLEWNADGRFSEKHDTISEGRSLMLDFSGITYKWMTTTVDEILENTENYIKFKTKNSVYELFINSIKK